MKKKFFAFLFPALALTSLIAVKPNSEIVPAQAIDGPSIANSGDAFALMDKQYAASESFVYTADMHFRSGQAGGLAFGSQENDHYFVINMDRNENHVKLLYFYSNGSGGYDADELYVDYFIGNNKMTIPEKDMVEPSVRGIENVSLKVVLSIEDVHAYAEFYVEGIKRFGIDTTIDLKNIAGKSYSYEGGYLGVNCFNSDIYFKNVEIGKSDYSYFSEQYRNQYHLQPFAKWTNDPNALCYHNGYYHVFYQTNPFGLQWGDMYWGHARSLDLIHFEFLPICLFPRVDGTGTDAIRSYMWSGCAISYKAGMSASIDSQGWFDASGGDGLFAVFTNDTNQQYQVIMTSTDDGLTWDKHQMIPQNVVGDYAGKIDLRDPKIFPLEKDGLGNVTTWGMTLSSYGLNKGWFLKSDNLLSWSKAGEFPLPTPECIGVGFLKDEHDVEHAYLTNKSRTYILGTLEYDGTNIIFRDENGVDISTYSVDNIPLQPLDFGPDSYASQSFYINDPMSEFYGKDIVLNWFSGDLNASFCTGPGEYAGLRERWNGGFTIPVEYGLKESTEGLRITQKPITVNNANLEKTNIINIAGEDFNSESENPLADVHTHIFELEAEVKTNDDSPIVFRVDIGNDEYMEFGWNDEDGYYVDRTNLDDKGINTNIDWHARYSSHLFGDSDVKTFYVLSDNGGLEVFCEDYSISFYFVTTASVCSTGASFQAGDATVNRLKINEVKSIYRKDIAPGEGVLYVSDTSVELGTTFARSKFVTCWFSEHENLVWEELSNEDVVSYVTSNDGINVTSLKEGVASFKVSVGEHEETINVVVYNSYFNSEFTFADEDVVSGNWLMTSGKIIGEKKSGNGFLLTQESGSDFTFSGQFDILSGTAASLVFRAADDMSSFLVANYDTNEKVVKLWSKNGELTRSEVIDVPSNDIVLSIRAFDRDVSISINGTDAINYVLPSNEPLSGKFGLNVFSGKAQFESLAIVREDYEYQTGELEIAINSGAYVTSVTNITLGNILLSPDFYHQDGEHLYINESYFELLENGTYRFRVVTSTYSFEIRVEVNSSFEPHIDDVETEEEFDVVVYIGSIEVSSVSVNGETLDSSDYLIKDYTLIINKDCFVVGENSVTINGLISFKVTIIERTPSSSEESSEEPSSSETSSEEPSSSEPTSSEEPNSSEPTTISSEETTSSENGGNGSSAGIAAFIAAVGIVGFIFIIFGGVVVVGGVTALVIVLVKRKSKVK